ncbi:hypothetical protein EfmJHP38_11100 [Enterococcus faecium]|nr:hypothetical protein EfmJHP38_11100 [Enterococcus faecium]
MSNGYIQFTLLGGNESRGGILAATKDENTVMFTKKYWNEMENLDSSKKNREKITKEAIQDHKKKTLKQKKTKIQIYEKEDLL